MEIKHQVKMVTKVQAIVITASRRNLIPWSIFAVILVWLLYRGIRSRNVSPSPNFEPKSVNDLLLLSNMRSGSTLLGQLLRDLPGTFFVFEPLQPLAPYHYFTEKSVFRIRDTECSTDNVDERIDKVLHTVHAIFSCNVNAIPEVVLNRILYENKSGEAWYKLGRCLNENSQEKSKKESEHCFEDIETDCKSAQTRIAKVLRLDLSTAITLFRNLPTLKIVLLYRDPRAIMNSRIKTDWFPVQENNTNEVISNINSLCVKMENDRKAFKSMELTVRNQVAVMKTEDVFGRNKGVLNVFKFINKRVTAKEVERVEAVVSGKTLFREWKKDIRTEYRIQTEFKCREVLSLYGES